MIIGFGNGGFYRLFSNSNERFSDTYLSHYTIENKTEAFELHCLDENHLDFLIQNPLDFSRFSFLSLHTPDLRYKDDIDSRRVFSKFEVLFKKYQINNFVFHTDKVENWSVFLDYSHLPFSIENMDERKSFGKSVEEIGKLIDTYHFPLTLDLQHCFVNDRSLKLATDFQEKYGEKIIEYHISGYEEANLHYPLFKTHQDEIISALKFKDVPIIIESTFDTLGEQVQEFEYIHRHLKTHNP